MNKYCLLCGSQIDESNLCENEHKFKKMCVNCRYVASCNGGFICTNPEHMDVARNKAIEAAKQAIAGYSINVEVSPLPLKNPIAKCSKWEIKDSVIEYIKNSFE